MPNPTRTSTPGPERSPQPAGPSLREFAQRFLLQRRQDVQRAQEGLAERSFPDLVQLGSQIMGSGPTFGFPEVGSAGARLEAAARAGDPDGVASALEALRRLLGAR